MLLLPMTVRANFWAMKFISFVLFEQLNSPNALRAMPRRRRAAKPAAARSSASSHVAGRSASGLADQRLTEPGDTFEALGTPPFG